MSQNIVPKSIVRFHIFWNLQYLIFQLLERFGAKTVFSCKNVPLNCKNTNALYRFTNFKNLFLKINFPPIFYDILNEIAISQERYVRFQKFLHQNWAERTAAIKEMAKSQFWSSETTGPFRCVESHIYIYQRCYHVILLIRTH